MDESGRPNPFLGVSLIAAMLVVTAAMVVAIFIAGQRPRVVVVAGTPGPGAPITAVASTTAAAATPASASPAAPSAAAPPAEEAAEPAVRIVRVLNLPALDEPFSPRWRGVPVCRVDVQPQTMTQPMLEEATIDAVEVQAVADQRMIVWRLSWLAPQPSVQTEVGRFTDAVALQFPLATDASFMMGQEGKPVQVLYWKALWQQDLDVGYQDVTDLYPNAWTDLYWFASGSFPYRVDRAFDDVRSHGWFVAEQAGNPVSQRLRAQPVQEMIAEGFGTLTNLPESYTVAHGEWRDGRWTVLIARPIGDGHDALAERLASGATAQVAVAVWDGSADNVGGRKHWSAWMPLEMPR